MRKLIQISALVLLSACCGCAVVRSGLHTFCATANRIVDVSEGIVTNVTHAAKAPADTAVTQ